MEIYFPWHRALVLLLLKKQGNSTFCKVVKQKGEGKPTFSTRSFPLSLRPSPLPCGDQGSPPGPPMPCFVAQSLGFAAFKKAGKFYFLQSSQTKGRDVLAAFATLVCQRNCVFFAKAQNLRIRRSRILGIVCRFSPWNVFPPMKPAF